jgi:hypothetical protein
MQRHVDFDTVYGLTRASPLLSRHNTRLTATHNRLIESPCTNALNPISHSAIHLNIFLDNNASKRKQGKSWCTIKPNSVFRIGSQFAGKRVEVDSQQLPLQHTFHQSHELGNLSTLIKEQKQTSCSKQLTKFVSLADKR